MKIEQITEQYVGEGTAGSTIYIGMADEAHVGMHLIIPKRNGLNLLMVK